MTDPQRPPNAGETAKLTPDEARLVARIEQHYHVPERSPDMGVLFQEALDARLGRNRNGFGWGTALASLAGVGALCAVTWGVFVSLTPEPASEAGTSIASLRPVTALDVTPEEALFALSEDASETGEELPDDYQAIASLFLGDAV